MYIFFWFSVILYFINKLGPTCVHTCRFKESSATHHHLFFLIPETLPHNYTVQLGAPAPLQSRLIIWVKDIITKMTDKYNLTSLLLGTQPVRIQRQRVCETKVSLDCFTIKYMWKKLKSVTPTCWIENPWLSDASVT